MFQGSNIYACCVKMGIVEQSQVQSHLASSYKYLNKCDHFSISTKQPQLYSVMFLYKMCLQKRGILLSGNEI